MKIINALYEWEKFIVTYIWNACKFWCINKTLELSCDDLYGWKESSCPDKVEHHIQKKPDDIYKKDPIQEAQDKSSFWGSAIKTLWICKCFKNIPRIIRSWRASSNIDSKAFWTWSCGGTDIEFWIWSDILKWGREIWELINNCRILLLHGRIESSNSDKRLEFLRIIRSTFKLARLYKIFRKEGFCKILERKNIHNNREDKRETSNEWDLVKEAQGEETLM